MLDSFNDLLLGRYNMTKDLFIERINRLDFRRSEAMMRGEAFHTLTESAAFAKDYYVKKKGIYQLPFYAFNADVVDEMIELRSGGIQEQYCEGVIETKYGLVTLYGKIDTKHPLLDIDVKTSAQYYDLKFFDAWQWRVYMYCTKAPEFLYAITDFVNIYYEHYTVYNSLEDDLRTHVQLLQEFIVDNREKIIDKKLFT